MCHPSNHDRNEMEEKYDIHYGHVLGEGTYATVYAATDKVTGEKMAIKAVRRK